MHKGNSSHRNLFGSAFEYTRPGEPEKPLGYRPGQSYWKFGASYGIADKVLDLEYVKEVKQFYEDEKNKKNVTHTWDERNGQLTQDGYLSLSDEQRLSLERLHAIKDDLKGAVNAKYTALLEPLVTADQDDTPEYKRLDEEKKEVSRFIKEETGDYDKYYFLSEILKYHQSKYPGEEAIDDPVLLAILKEFKLDHGFSADTQRQIIASFNAIESTNVPAGLKEVFRSEQEKIVNAILCADTEGKRYANLEELQRIADVAASADQDALAKAEYLLGRLKEHVDTHSKAITDAIRNPAYEHVSEQDKQAFQQKYKHLHTELSGEINALRASISDEQRKQVRANKPSSSTESLIRQTAAMSDYVNAILPSQNRSESTAANTNPLKTLIASEEQIREANAAYVKAQPTPSKIEKAKRIGLLVLGVVAAAALLVVGVGACVATAGVAVPVITGLGLATATTVGIGAGGAAAGTAAAIVTGVYAGSSSDGSRKRKNTDHLTDATTKVAKTACPFQAAQQQAEEITPGSPTPEL